MATVNPLLQQIDAIAKEKGVEPDIIITALQDAIEAAGALAKNYTLEVSSPGLDRPLRHEADYRRFAGRLAKVVTTAPIGGQSAFSGRIMAVEQGDLILEEGRKRHKVPVAQIKRGHLAVEF